jgi:hypothetical protein
MLKKKVLSSAVVAALGSLVATSVLAVPPEMGSPSDANVFAVETVEANQIGSSGLYVVNDDDSNTIFALDGTLGFGQITNTVLYLRYDLYTQASIGGSGLKPAFNEAVMAGDLWPAAVPAGVTVEVAEGGAIGQNYVVFAITTDAETSLPEDQSIYVDFGDSLDIPLQDIVAAKRLSDQAAVLSGPDNINIGIENAYVPFTPFINLRAGFEFVIVPRPENLVADVLAPDGVFTDFVPEQNMQGYPQSIGFVEMNIQGNDADTGMPVDADDFLDGDDSTLTISGPLGWAYDVRLSMDDTSNFNYENCQSGGDYFDIADDDMSASVNLGDVAEYAGDKFHVCLYPNMVDVIPEVDNYPALFTPNLSANVGPVAGTLAGIDHNGTKFRLELGSNFETYNQKLVLVNKSDAPMPYHIEFISEEGVVAIPGDGAEGIIPAMGMIVIPQTQIVTWEGKSRGSYCIVVAGDDRDAGAMHISTNKETGDEAKVRLTIEAAPSQHQDNGYGYYPY